MLFRQWIIDPARIPPLTAYSNLNNNQMSIYVHPSKTSMCHLKPSIVEESRQHAEQLKEKICKFTDS